MKKYILLFLFTTTILASSQNADKNIRLLKIDHEIKLDGIIDPVWNEADSATNFFQLQPYYDKPPTYKTVAKVLTSSDALYCLIICYDDQNDIQKTTGMLDQFSGDIVSIMLDTFGDKKTAYKFAVTASNVRNDARMLDDNRNRDYSWDGIWFSSTKIYKWGFVVEMKIPYKSIQYNDKLNVWGVDFDRWIPAKTEDLYWCRYNENEGMRVSKFGSLNLDGFKPPEEGLNLEIYPVGISKATYLNDGKYKVDPEAGLDILYNPSSQLKFQFTANPDFAQIEADPFEFNISRYETFFSERRPFFTEGNEIFMASGKQNNTGFYSPLDLFYSRRIGKKLPDGSDVPLNFGTKAFGRIHEWEYGGFIAKTGEKNYMEDDTLRTEQKAFFGSARIKRNFWENSQVGLLFVGKQTKDNNYGVLDIDGAFRESDWQLSYQLARSFENSKGDYAASAGFINFGKTWINFAKTRLIGNNFDISQIGYVPWKGTGMFSFLTGPVWLMDKGYIRQILIYGGTNLYYEDADLYTDHSAFLGFNMQLRDNWGYEINVSLGKSKDSDIKYTSYSASLSSWFNTSPSWSGNLWGGYEKTYNFNREYLAFYTYWGASIDWIASDILTLGTSYNMYIEGNPQGNIEDITYNARPYFSLTPVNNLNIRIYVDNLFVRSADKLEHVIGGLLFAWNFLPKSWVYFAINEVRDRSDEYGPNGDLLPSRMHVVNRAGVLKLKYLYYF